MAAVTRAFFFLAALGLSALANIPRASFVAENSHQGAGSFALGSHRGPADANALIAPGLCGCLYDSGGRSRSTGKERDAETGLDYFGARYLSAAQGRWTSPDPLLSSGRPWDPQSWNRYSYVLNNPLRYTDPLGLYVWDGSLGGDTADDEVRKNYAKKQANQIIIESRIIQ